MSCSYRFFICKTDSQRVRQWLVKKFIDFSAIFVDFGEKELYNSILQALCAETARAGFENAGARQRYLSAGEYFEGGAENVRNY